jgi:hypothetical protein
MKRKTARLESKIVSDPVKTAHEESRYSLGDRRDNTMQEKADLV